MARGGARAGAGRPKGAQNRRTVEQVEAIEASGLTPLDYLLGVMRNAEEEKAVRIDAAKAAAPYCHAKLSAVELSGDPDKPVETVTRIELIAVRPSADG